jgi:hypothetical protein
MRILWTTLLVRLQQGTLPRWLARHTMSAISRDVELAAQYDALWRAERAASGNADVGLSDAQKQRLWSDLAKENTTAAARLPRFVPIGAVSAVACAAIAVIALRSPADGIAPMPLGELSARAALVEKTPLGVRVRCLVNNDVTDDAVFGARQTGANLRCADRGILAFSTTNFADTARFAFVVGVDAQGNRFDVAPFFSTSQAVSLGARTTDMVLNTLAPMSALSTGDITLFVLLSEQPFSGEEIAQRLDAAARSAVPLGQLERLPVDVPVQARMSIVRTR